MSTKKIKYLNWKIHCEDHSSLSSITAVQIYELFHIYLHHFTTPYGKIWTQQIGLAPNVWLHSSVGRASHRYRGGHGFESRWSPDFFQASSFQLFKLENSLRGSFFTFIYYRSSNIWIISYILTSRKIKSRHTTQEHCITGIDEINLSISQPNKFHPRIKCTAEISEKERNFIDTTTVKAKRVYNDSVLEVRTHFKMRHSNLRTYLAFTLRD